MNEQNKYFARSFTHSSWKDFKENELGGGEVEFAVDFAWSCWSCMFEGYPDDYEECVTLEWACKEYNIEIEIETEELGMGFEEKVFGSKNGVTYDSKDIPTYKCKCGSEQFILSNRDLKNEECYECEKIGGFELVK